MNNSYDILGVRKDSTKEEIIKARKKLCTKYHPDQPTGNVEKFNEVNKAFDLIMSNLDCDCTLERNKMKKSMYLRHSTLFDFRVVSS